MSRSVKARVCCRLHDTMPLDQWFPTCCTWGLSRWYEHFWGRAIFISFFFTIFIFFTDMCSCIFTLCSFHFFDILNTLSGLSCLLYCSAMVIFLSVILSNYISLLVNKCRMFMHIMQGAIHTLHTHSNPLPPFFLSHVVACHHKLSKVRDDGMGLLSGQKKVGNHWYWMRHLFTV